MGSGCTILEAPSDLSLRDSQTDVSLPPVAASIPKAQTLVARATTMIGQTHGVLPSPPPPYSMVDEPRPFASPPPPYDSHHASLTPSLSLEPRATVQKYPTQRPRTLHRRCPRPFQRPCLPEDGTSQGIALQPDGEQETEPNAAWKRQVRADRLALNSLVEANQERVADAVPNDRGNGADLSEFNSRYQEFLGGRGLSTINEFTRHMERLFEL